MIKAIILAAGKGTRMKSHKIKVLHHVGGKPVVAYVIETVKKIGVTHPYLVVGYQADELKQELNDGSLQYVLQEQQLGTGHAVMQVAPFLEGHPDEKVVILAGDCPLIQPETLKNLLDLHDGQGSSGTILSVEMDEPGNYGRILRNGQGFVDGIREAKDCNPEQLKVKEINTGVYMFNGADLKYALGKLDTNNAQNEYYLTDVFHIMKKEGRIICAYCMQDPDQAIGINTRMDLAMINSVIQRRINTKWMEEGVTLLDPATTFIDDTVDIGKDTVVSPCVVLKGHTKIGEGCDIGAFSHLTNAVVHSGDVIPPYTHKH